MSLFATGAGGVRLRCRVAGPRDAPVIVFIHGWSQSLDAWDLLFDSRLVERFQLVAYDLRGHGHSDAPLGANHYSSGELWADDLLAVIDQASSGEQPVVLAAWSYGGFIVSDYLRHHHGYRVAGIAYIGASINLDGDQVPDYLAPDFLELAGRAASLDPDEVETAIREFVALCTAEPLDPSTFDDIIAFNLATRPDVRAALGDRRVSSDDLLAAVKIPVCVIQGAEDAIVLPATADAIAAVCPTAEVILYDNVGHLPMVEAPERLAADLERFVHRCVAAAVSVERPGAATGTTDKTAP